TVVLQRGHVEEGPRFFSQRAILDVFDDAHDLVVRAEDIVLFHKSYPSSQSELRSRPEASRHCFIDDDNWRRPLVVLRAEFPTGQERNTHCFEVTRPDRVK